MGGMVAGGSMTSYPFFNQLWHTHSRNGLTYQGKCHPVGLNFSQGMDWRRKKGNDRTKRDLCMAIKVWWSTLANKESFEYKQLIDRILYQHSQKRFITISVVNILQKSKNGAGMLMR